MGTASNRWNALFRTKNIERAVRDAESPASGLVRRLGPVHLITLGVGSIVGAGIFVVTGGAAAEFAGPAIIFSFMLAALGCALAGLCYAEFASVMPVSGSAYAYAYATLGEVVAWMIGWVLISEYLFAGSYIAVGWSGYAVSLLSSFGVVLPDALTHGPLSIVDGRFGLTGAVINLPSVVVALGVMLVARRGIGLSAMVNTIIVVLKVGVLLLFLLFGLQHVHLANWTPFLPANTGQFGSFGVSGVLRGAAVVFVAYLGFDALTTTAQEAHNPQRDMPIGLLGSLAICALLYGGVALVLTGLTPYRTLDAPNPLSVALRGAGGALDWLVPIVDVAAVAGLASVLLTIIIALPRVLLAMGRDGLLPSAFAKVHPRFHTPSLGTIVAGAVMATLSGLFPIQVLVQLLSLGTLSVFIVVCFGVLVLRRTRPELKRPFRVPFSPVTPLLGAAVCIYLLSGLPARSWIFYAGWTTCGLLVYAAYGFRGAGRMRRLEVADETA